MHPQNLVILLSDEHNARFLGCRNHPVVKTPNIDKLAGRGTLFRSAYCASPICVPSRASLATGRYACDTGFWDNAAPYDGSVPSWGHRLQEQGHLAVSIGKLHYRSADDSNGFEPEINPLHVLDGLGDLIGLIRKDMPERPGSSKFAAQVGRGETSYTKYDRDITARAVDWISKAPADGKPWVLFVSFVAPHFPLVAPEQFYDLYKDLDIDPASFSEGLELPDHPYYREMARNIAFDDYFDDAGREEAIRGYLGLCSFLDDNVGQVLGALDAAGLSDTTRVIYASDHGENLGKRGLWGKSTMYEESVAVPLIMAGPGIEAGCEVNTPVSLVDIFPTVLDAVGAALQPADEDLPGASLFDVASGAVDERPIFSEYHAAGSVTGNFMLLKGRYKLITFAGMEPQLFDLETDPLETADLAAAPENAGLITELLAELEKVTDTASADRRAKESQCNRIEAVGGLDAILKRGDFGYSPPPKG